MSNNVITLSCRSMYRCSTTFFFLLLQTCLIKLLVRNLPFYEDIAMFISFFYAALLLTYILHSLTASVVKEREKANVCMYVFT